MSTTTAFQGPGGGRGARATGRLWHATRCKQVSTFLAAAAWECTIMGTSAYWNIGHTRVNPELMIRSRCSSIRRRRSKNTSKSGSCRWPMSPAVNRLRCRPPVLNRARRLPIAPSIGHLPHTKQHSHASIKCFFLRVSELIRCTRVHVIIVGASPFFCLQRRSVKTATGYTTTVGCRYAVSDDLGRPNLLFFFDGLKIKLGMK